MTRRKSLMYKFLSVFRPERGLRSDKPGAVVITPGAMGILRECPLFRSLNEIELSEIAALCHEESYEAQQTIFTQGESAERFYVISEGTVALIRSANIGDAVIPVRITTELVKSGEICGWSALFSSHVYTASAICQTPTRVIAIAGPRLRPMLAQFSSLSYKVTRNLAEVLASRIAQAYQAMEYRL